MKMKYLLAASVVSLTAGAALVATPAAAQQITSGVQGFVTDEAGNPLSAAQVVVTDTRTGTSRTLTAGEDGSFRVDLEDEILAGAVVTHGGAVVHPRVFALLES